MAGDASHVFEEHTGEVQLRVEAAGLRELFAEAGLALAELMVERLPTELDANEEAVTVAALDREGLLVEWLNEIIFRSETRKKVYTRFEIQGLSDEELRATMRGAAVTELRTAVKAATMHRLRILERPGGYTATVVLDV